MAADPLHLDRPRRVREAIAQLEDVTASSVVHSVQVALRTCRAAENLSPEDHLGAVLTGLVEAYAVLLETAGATGDEPFQRRAQARGIARAAAKLAKAGQTTSLELIPLPEKP